EDHQLLRGGQLRCGAAAHSAQHAGPDVLRNGLGGHHRPFGSGSDGEEGALGQEQVTQVARSVHDGGGQAGLHGRLQVVLGGATATDQHPVGDTGGGGGGAVLGRFVAEEPALAGVGRHCVQRGLDDGGGGLAGAELVRAQVGADQLIETVGGADGA